MSTKRKVIDRKVSRQALAMLKVLADGEEHYGYEICKETDLGTGTVYNNLIRFRDRGWVTSRIVMPEDKTETQSATRYRHAIQLTQAGKDYVLRELIK